MEYVGIDLHKKGFRACVMDQTGQVLHSEGYKNSEGEVETLLETCSEPSFVIEATQNWMWMVRILEKRGAYP